MKNKRHLRNIAISMFVIILTLGNYLRLTGIENIRAIHIVTLLTCGAAIGILLQNVAAIIMKRINNDK